MSHVAFGWRDIAIVIWTQNIYMLSVFQRQPFDRHFMSKSLNCWSYVLADELLGKFIIISFAAYRLCVLPFFLLFKWVVVHRVWLTIQVQSMEVMVANFELAWLADWFVYRFKTDAWLRWRAGGLAISLGFGRDSFCLNFFDLIHRRNMHPKVSGQMLDLFCLALIDKFLLRRVTFDGLQVLQWFVFCLFGDSRPHLLSFLLSSKLRLVSEYQRGRLLCCWCCWHSFLHVQWREWRFERSIFLQFSLLEGGYWNFICRLK